MVTHADPQSTSRTTFADHHADNRNFQRGHITQVDRDIIRLTAFFCANPRICTGCIDQANNGQTIATGHFHLLHGLAVAFRMSTSVAAFVAFFQVSAFLMSDEHHFPARQSRKSRDDGSIIPKRLVSMQFDEFVEHQFQIIGCLRSIRMARDLNGLPWVQMRITLTGHLSQFNPHSPHDLLFGRSGIQLRFELQKSLFQFVQWLLKW